MNDIIVNVIVKWMGHKANNLLANSQYITVAKFKEDVNWEKEAWSVMLYFDIFPKAQGNPSVGKALFLSEKAPNERLKKGNVFELYEGKNKVAIVKIV